MTLKLDDGSETELEITTEPIREDFPKIEVVKANKKEMADGLTFLQPEDMIEYVGIDANGDIRSIINHEHIVARELKRISNGRLLIPSFLNNSGRSFGVTEIDFLGKIYNDYMIPGGSHHDFIEMPNGNFLVASEGNLKVREIDRESGEVVKTVNIPDFIGDRDSSRLEDPGDNWIHNNSLHFDEPNDTLIMSCRNISAVIAIKYSTMELKWIFGDPEGWTKTDLKYFFKPEGKNFEWQYEQHTARLTPEGRLTVFDNGVYRAKSTNPDDAIPNHENYSRAVIYELDEESMTAKQVWEYGKERGPEWFSGYLCDFEHFSENHHLITSGGIIYNTETKRYGYRNRDTVTDAFKKIAEINEFKNNKEIFRLEFAANVYRSERLPLYSDKVDFDLYAEAKRLSKIDPENFTEETGLNVSDAKAPDFFEIRKKELTLESVMVEGAWDTGKYPGEAKLVLKPVNEDKYLSVVIRPPRQIAEDKPNVFNSLVSVNGLSGDYDLYIYANETLYDLNLRFNAE